MQLAESRLLDLATLVDKPAPDQPDEVSRALARFLVVRTCGYLEQTTEDCCRAYADSKSSPAVAAFCKSWLGKGRTPTPGHLVELVRRFEPRWGDELQALFDADDEFLKREISLLVDRRIKIAHGLSEGLGARKALDLLEAVGVVTDWFVTRFDPR